MVHMDLKMDNILVVNDKSYISDFGKVERINKIIPSAQGNYLNYHNVIQIIFQNILSLHIILSTRSLTIIH